MRKNKLCILFIAFVMLEGMTACAVDNVRMPDKSAAQIYLYGEQGHGVDKILAKEFALWREYYHNDDMRHLFLELPFHTAEFLNIWLQEDSDDILEDVYADLEGTAAHVPAVKDFYKKIKAECPETIFHGTDVGHQFYSTGERFIEYLVHNNLEDSEQYLIAKEVIAQGQYFYEHSDDVYRENKMTENFIREFDLLAGEKIMGIYGGAHTGLVALDFTRKVPCMANQLREHYGDIIYSEDLP